MRRGAARGRWIALTRPPPGRAQDIFKLYKLGKELGRGQFGTVQECVELATGKLYACKVISKHKLKSKEEIEDVRREVAIMYHLAGNPNIARHKTRPRESLMFPQPSVIFLVIGKSRYATHQ